MKRILQVKDLRVNIKVHEGTLQAVRGLDFEIYEGESLGIVGESGSGKSMAMKAILGLLPENAIAQGEVLYQGRDDLLKMKQRRWDLIRGNEIGIVTQNPSSNLSPIIKVGKQMMDAIYARAKNKKAAAKRFLKQTQKQLGIELFKMELDAILEHIDRLDYSIEYKRQLKHEITQLRSIYNTDISKKALKSRAISLLRQVGIDDPESRFDQYPFELSGGMNQRIVIAIVLSGNPSLLIFDEPTTSLDVTIQAQIIALIKKLQIELGFALIFISHNLAVISKIAKKVLVMYAGKAVEFGSVEDIYKNAKHPYTKALLKAVPDLKSNRKRYAIKGISPTIFADVDMDLFAYRNEHPMAIDFKKEPPLFKVKEGHYARTWLWHEFAPEAYPEDPYDDLSPIRRSAHDEVLLEMHHLGKTFPGKNEDVIALKDVSLTLHKGEILCIVGESGSGKTTLARALTGLVKLDQGTIILEGKELGSASKNKKYQYDYSRLGSLGMIFQDSMSSLDSRMTIGGSIQEGLVLSSSYQKEEIQQKTLALLSMVDLDTSILNRYPYMVSGGQRQRAQIARALALSPKVLIADEPVSDLDVSIQANIIHLFDKVRNEMGISIIFITHDLSVVRYLADKVAVFYQGRVVEYGDQEDIFLNPLHPYTKRLLNSVPTLDLDQEYDVEEDIAPIQVQEGDYEELGNGHLVFVATRAK